MKLPPYLTTNVAPLNFWMLLATLQQRLGFGDEVLHGLFRSKKGRPMEARL